MINTTYNRGMAQHLVFDRVGLAHPYSDAAGRPQRAIETMLCKWAPASFNPYRGRNCTTRFRGCIVVYVLLSSWGMTASYSSNNPRTSAN